MGASGKSFSHPCQLNVNILLLCPLESPVGEMLPTLSVCGRASVAGGGECRLPLCTSDVRGRRSVVVRITVVDTSDG